MDRLLREGIKTNFQSDQVSLSDVTALLHKNKISNAYLTQETDPLYEGLPTYYAVQPPDFLWLASGRVETAVDTVMCDSAPTATTINTVEHIQILGLPNLPTTAPFWSTVAITSTVKGGLYGSPAGISSGFQSPRSSYVMVNNVLDTMYRKFSDVKVYWERYRDINYPGKFIIVSTTDLGVVTMTATGIVSTAAKLSNSYTMYNRGSITTNPTAKLDITPCRNTQDDMLYPAIKQNKFYRSSVREVVINQTGDYFIIYPEQSFIVTRFMYDYIRKPKTISLALDQTCELADSTHDKVVDLAVEILRLDTKNETYPATVQDTQLRT
jgi:hypothetical protein